MSSPLSTAVTGLYRSVALATQSASNIANASLTQANVDQDMVNLEVAKTTFQANASLIKTEDKMQKSLLDITV